MSVVNRFPSNKLLFFSALAIFVLALLPRLIHLGGFLTTDERFWIESSRDFLGGLISRDFPCPPKTEHKGEAVLVAGQGLACTLRAGHPGVVTMWSGSLGIWLYYLAARGNQSLLDFISVMPVKPVDPEIIPWVRLPAAGLAAVAIAITFFVLTRLLDGQGKQGYFVAVLAAILMALSPYQIALSRILHTDALETIFVTLSLLTAFYYWGNGASRRWLLASGALAGLSFLAKSPALFLVPFLALLGVWYLGWQWLSGQAKNVCSFRLFRRVMLDELSWLAIALLVYVLLWPAIWVIPGTVINYVFGVVFGYATELDDKGTYFAGSFVYDPGPLFYPVSWLMKTTPPVVFGVLLALFFWLKGNNLPKRDAFFGRLGYGSDNSSIERLLFLSLLFVVTFIIFLNMSSTKQIRYLLPAYPFFNIMAAIGWVWLAERVVPAAKHSAGKVITVFIVSLIAFNGLLVIFSFPYFFTYFNPMLGGIRVAHWLIPVGWGEGLDMAAEYLNQKPRAERLTVASWYGSSSFAPFFVGETLDYFQQKGNVLAGDYVVVYIYQRQRNLPDTELFDFLENYARPEKVIELAGIPYVWIYRGIGLDHHLEYARYHGLAELLGWEYTTPGIDPDHPLLRPGDSLEFDLWWEYLGKPAEEPFFVWLVGPDSRIWAETLTQPKPEAGQPAEWTNGKIVPETGRLVIPPGTPPGDYTIYIGFYPEKAPDPVQALLFDLGDNPRTVTIAPGSTEGVPSLIPLNIEAGPLRLVGWQSPDLAIKLDEPFELELYWQTLQDVNERYQLSLALLDKTGTPRWEWERTDPVSFYPTPNWTKDELVRSQLSVQPTQRTPGGQYQLALNIYAGEELVRTVPLLPVIIPGWERQFTLTDQINPVQALFNDGITLLGFQTETEPAYHPGDQFAVRLYWQAQRPIENDYTVFVQLVGQDGQIYGQMDAQPHNGDHPTSHWTPGEIVQDSYTFYVSQDAAPGDYELIVGLYQFETGQRVRLAQSDQTYEKVLDLRIE
jgi:hypothetical protein